MFDAGAHVYSGRPGSRLADRVSRHPETGVLPGGRIAEWPGSAIYTTSSTSHRTRSGDSDPDEVAALRDRWVEVANRPHVTATVSEFGADLSLGTQARQYIGDRWSALTEEVDLDRSALVSDSIGALATEANLDTDDYEIEVFDDVDDAVAWVRE